MYRCFRFGIVAVVWWTIVKKGEGNVVRNEDICGVQNGRRLYLELGEKGILYAKNVSFVRNEPRQDGLRVYASNGSHAQCSLELVTCPSCVIIVTFQSIALSHHCGDGSVTIDSPCRCDYVWISEPPYEDVSGTPFCGLYAPITYRSSTRTLSITLLYSQSHKHAFTLEYTAERNRLHLRGTQLTTTGQAAKGLNSTGGGILTSPFFPVRYPRDLGLEYVVTCPNEAPSCRIRLLFSDFQLATVSIMEFYDWNGQRLDVSSGARFRPPVIMSSGPSLLIRFYANGGTGLGYKAFYSFVIGHPLDKSVQPITDCGGYVENLGGAITMMDMVGEGVKTYDCVWLIRPPKNFLHMKTHMYLKVITFADMAGNTELVVKQGPTSALLPLEILRHPASQVQPPGHREHVAPVTSGFHVSLRGTFGPSSRLGIAYAAFSYMDCFAGSEFLCRNHRCIPNELNCDGFDHCGDNSDEPATCFQDWEVEAQDRKWHSNKANYYFPKIDRYPDLKTATLVFVASSLGLIVLISALIILLYRIGARARQQRELQSRLQTISELLDGARIDEISVSDDPPVYEAPPGYDEVVKFGFDSEVFARKKRKALSRESRSRTSPGRSCSSSVCSVSETAGTSRSNRESRGPTWNRRSCLPESPPPPYVTPPGSMSRNFSSSSFVAGSSTSPIEGETDHAEAAVAAVVVAAREQEGDAQETEEEKTRQEWLRRVGRSSSCSSSTTSSRSLSRSSEPMVRAGEVRERSSPSIDVELLGAYSQNRDASSLDRTVDASCDSQPSTSRVVSTNIERTCDGEEGGERLSAEQRAEDVATAVTAATVGSRANPTLAQIIEDGAEPTVVNTVKTAKTIRSGCSCEGACGCAIVRRLPEEAVFPPLRPLRRLFERNEHNGTAAEKKREDEEKKEEEEEARKAVMKEEEEQQQQQQEVKEEEEEEDEEEEEAEEENRSRSRSAIVRLLGGRPGRRQSGSGPSTVASTATSTPCGGTLRRSTSRFPVCSRDNCLGRMSTIGSTSSYEKLNNREFEFSFEMEGGRRHGSVRVSDPSAVGSNRGEQRRRGRRYSSCDLESLCEGIRILDGFLARRGLSVTHGRRQSAVTVMLFGTPEHGTIRRRAAGEEEIDRVSRFSLDAVSK